MRLLSFAFPIVSLAVFGAAVLGGVSHSQSRDEPQLTKREAALHKPTDLKPVSAFASIQDPKARSLALIEEAGKVIQHPRCVNCHPVDGRPRQGLDGHPHNPPMFGGTEGKGVAGLKCTACHGATNFAVGGEDTRSIPGNPKWALAPAESAWHGKSRAATWQAISARASAHLGLTGRRRRPR